MKTLNPDGFLIHPGGYRNLYCYKKSVILYDMTFYYIEKYLQPSDRTYGQMKQAARSGKQNIVEGLEDKMTSFDTGLHLVNVARGSLQELREDYEDEIRSNRLAVWKSDHERYNGMIQFCMEHAEVEDYAKYYEQWNQETICNVALTLIHQADKALMSLLKKMEADFLKEGGVKERMFSARKEKRGF